MSVAAALSILLTLAACDSASSSKSAGSTTSTTLPPCPQKAVKTVAAKGASTSGPVAGTVSVAPGPVSVISGVVTDHADAPVTLAVVASHGADRVVVPTTAAAASQEVPLLGLHPTTDYDVAVTATATSGQSETVHLTFSTGSLPSDLPPVRTTVSRPTAMAPGFTLLNTMPWGAGAKPTCKPPTSRYSGWIIGVNDAGDVVWYYRSKVGIADVSPTKQGTLLLSMNDVVIREIDMLGNTLNELGTRVATEYVKTDIAGAKLAGPNTKPIDIDSAHHEVTQMPNGDLMTLSTEIVTLDPNKAKGMCKGVKDAKGKPVSDPDAVVADIVTELTPAGDVVKEWHLHDYFDPYTQPGSDMCVPTNPIAPPNWFYPKRPGLRDWMHTNAAVLDPVTNTIDVSIRHLDTVLGIRYADDAGGKAGTVAWKLSPKGGTLDLTSGSYAYHGHAIEPDSDNRLLYFDNGNGRPGTAAGGGDKPPLQPRGHVPDRSRGRNGRADLGAPRRRTVGRADLHPVPRRCRSAGERERPDHLRRRGDPEERRLLALRRGGAGDERHGRSGRVRHDARRPEDQRVHGVPLGSRPVAVLRRGGTLAPTGRADRVAAPTSRPTCAAAGRGGHAGECRRNDPREDRNAPDMDRIGRGHDGAHGARRTGVRHTGVRPAPRSSAERLDDRQHHQRRGPARWGRREHASTSRSPCSAGRGGTGTQPVTSPCSARGARPASSPVTRAASRSSTREGTGAGAAAGRDAGGGTTATLARLRPVRVRAGYAEPLSA